MSITETKDGVIITIFVKPNSPKFSIELNGDEIVVHCTEEPVKGKVNKEIIKEFSKLLHAQVELASGATSRQKQLFVKRHNQKPSGKIFAVVLKNKLLIFELLLFGFSKTEKALIAGMKSILTIKMAQEEPEIAIVGTKGQIVIPQRLRKELKITSKTKLVVYRKGDKLVVSKLEVPPLGEELKDLFGEIDKQRKGKKVSEDEILREIQTYRLEKRAKKGA